MTSVPPSGIWNTTASQFFCQLVKNDSSQCFTSTQFATQDFHALCPSGDCWTDCQDLERLYSPLPSGLTWATPITYGTPSTQNVTLWPLCAAIGNISEAIDNNIAPKEDADKFQSFFSNKTKQNQLWSAAGATQCWTETCAQARHPEKCTDVCAAVNLLESHYEPQFAGTRECIRALCHDIDGLPFGNQDIVGIGVSISYLMQAALLVLCWIALAVNGLVTRQNRRQSRQSGLHESRTVFLEAVSGFQAAQCYFSIPLAVAAFFSDPFTLDPLNAFGLLPVSTNGFLPEIWTLMILSYYEVRHWYPFILTYISYILNSVTFWAVIYYLSGIKESTTALKRPAFESLGGLDACGGTTGLALCLQFQADSPPALLIRKYGSAAMLGIKLAPLVWSWCTVCLLLLTYFQFQTTELGSKLKAPFEAKIHKSRFGPFQAWCHKTLRSPILYYTASGLFFLGLLYQATLFYGFLSLGLVNLQTWTFGQIVSNLIMSNIHRVRTNILCRLQSLFGCLQW